MCKELLENNFTTILIYRSLICHNRNIAKIYGLVKLHKVNFPLRPLVAAIVTATDKIASFIIEVL